MRKLIMRIYWRIYWAGKTITTEPCPYYTKKCDGVVTSCQRDTCGDTRGFNYERCLAQCETLVTNEVRTLR